MCESIGNNSQWNEYIFKKSSGWANATKRLIEKRGRFDLLTVRYVHIVTYVVTAIVKPESPQEDVDL